LARALGVRLHTHLAETRDEEEYCLAHFGARPVDYVESLGWLGDDVWLAHCVHLSDGDIAKYAATGTGVAHCPTSNARLGSGIAPIPELLAAGAPVGLGVDGVASNEHGGLAVELHQALLFARARLGPQALSARQALWMATTGGARCLGRSDAIGSLEAGKLGDVALWRLDGLGHADISDPVCALVFGPPAPLELLLVGGRPVVDGDELRTADVTQIAAANRAGAGELARRAGVR
jgi:cytosine/adenosine deaminase-related metal-dependent hydrolase